MENGNTAEGLQDKTSGNVASSHTPKSKVNPMRWMFGAVARLFIWYAILTPFLYCPSNISELGEDSSRICKPYLVTRSYLEPHISPIYQTYAAPYVEIAKPYYDGFNEKIYTPTAKFTKDNYAIYGAPRVGKAKSYGFEQWETIAVPRLHILYDSVTDLYNTSIEPHRKNAVSIITPYYTVAQERAHHLHDNYIFPSYLRMKPFVSKAYVHGHGILADTVFPYIQRAWTFVMTFMDTIVWPRITGLYSQNVEPQLIRIGEKLASYREGRKLRAAVDEVDSSIEASISSTSVTSAASVTDSKGSGSTEAHPATSSLTPSQQKELAQEKIATDLKTWQEKFSIAADRGSDDLKERVQEIVGSQLESGAITYGESLVLALKKTAEEQLEGLKLKTHEIVESLPDACTSKDEEDARGELLDAVRTSGIAIRERAHKLREWFNNFDAELVRRVSAASDSTLDVLDSIRSLGLQEIGMRWAWMDGVTYKDWAKYHALKKQLAEWREEVRHVGMEHEDLKHARSMGSDILSNGMSIAESVAKELTRLKEIGKWKIEARDSSEDFIEQTVAAASVRADKGIPPCSADPSDRQLPPSSATSLDEQNTDQPSEGGNHILHSSTILVGAAAEVIDSRSSVDGVDEKLETLSAPAENSITTSASITASTHGALEHISSVASSRLQEGLSLASAEFSNAKAAVSASAEPGNHQVLLDAQRRYYEALGMAHDRYSVFMESASEAVFATTTHQGGESPAPTEEAKLPKYEDLTSAAKSEFLTVSSLASASSNAVVSSVSSAISSLGEEDAHSIINDVSSRYSAALSAASASLTSALSAASAVSDSASEVTSSSMESDNTQNWEALVSKASQSVYGMPTAYEPIMDAEETAEASAPESEAKEDSKESDEAEITTSSESESQDASTSTSVTSTTGSSVSPGVDASAETLPAVETVLGSVSEVVDSIVDSAKAHGSVRSDDDRAEEPEETEDATSKIEDAVSSAQTSISSVIFEEETARGSAPDAAESSVISNQKESALESAQSQLDEIVEKAESRLESPDSSEELSSATSSGDEFTKDTTVASAQTGTARDEL